MRTWLRLLPALALVVSVAFVPTGGMAWAVTQPDGRIVPQLNSGEDSDHPPGTALQKLFTNRGEKVGTTTLDYQKDALTSQTTFSPTCGSLTGTLVLHGGGCNLDFGWYNVNQSSSTPPPDNQIYTLVPASANSSFCPRSGPSNSCPAQLSQFSLASILTDSRYLGGQIGFALRGDAGSDCKQTHYSEARLNLTCDGGTTGGRCPVCTTANTPGCVPGSTATNPGAPWIMALTYQSLVSPNSYYLAFEDLPSSRTLYTAPGTPYANDGDFNDDVYFITGVTCQGGGTSCTTGQQGICAAGVNQCNKGNLVCTALEQPTTEVCDGLDNNCDGQVDNADPDPKKPLCPGSKICDRGTCVDFCVEQSCPIGQFCGSSGTCTDDACKTVSCGPGQRCLGGLCVGPCDGVVCPSGQVCRVGRCVDPCQNVACDTGFVCQDGVCKNSCSCTPCTGATTCTQDGRCTPNKCVGKTCAAGTVCNPSTGACDDACAGAKCPNGLVCETGKCVDKCANVSCPSGQKCQAGTCVNTGCAASACPQGFVCNTNNNTCEDACLSITCAPGLFCQFGTCIDPFAGTGGQGGSSATGGAGGATGGGGAAGGAIGGAGPGGAGGQAGSGARGGSGGSASGGVAGAGTGGAALGGAQATGGAGPGSGGNAGGSATGGVTPTGGAGVAGAAGNAATGGLASGGGGRAGQGGLASGGLAQGGSSPSGGASGAAGGGAGGSAGNAPDGGAATGGRLADASADGAGDAAKDSGATGGTTTGGGDSGCGCGVATSPSGAWAGMLLAMGLVIRRRRRR